jgi:hypothetical protein
MIPLIITTPTPSVHVSWLELNVISMSWTAAESTFSSGKTSVMTIVGNTQCQIQQMPSWITIQGYMFGLLSEGSSISDGDTLYVYPTVNNSGYVKHGYILFNDIDNNTIAIEVLQDAPVNDPVVIMAINPNDTSGMMFNQDYVVSATSGIIFVTVGFAVHVPNRGHGEQYSIFYSIVRDGVADNSGTLIVRDGIMNFGYVLQMSSPATTSEVITVYLSATYVAPPITIQDSSISADMLPLIITTPTPSVYVSELHASTTDMTWLATDSLFAKRIGSLFTVVGIGNIGYLVWIPSWIAVSDYTQDIPVGSVIDGAVVGLYPTDANTGGTRTDSVTWRDFHGNEVVFTVTQAGSLSNATVTVQMSPSDTSGITIFSISGTSTNGNTSISITFTPRNIALGYMTSFSLNYQIWKNSIVVGSGVLYPVRNLVSNTFSLTMSNPANAGESIIVFLSAT